MEESVEVARAGVAEFLRKIAEYAGFESRCPDHAEPSKTQST